MSKTSIKGLIQQKLGLDPGSIGAAAIESAIAQRMAACGATDSSAYLKKVQSLGNELESLIDAVVVPETWFFRGEEAFALLKQYAVKDWQPAHAGEVFRILSIPCASGEEPYSAAMALLDAGQLPASFAIDAVDVSTQALARAKAAVYNVNSFRAADLSFRERYFDPAPADPGCYRLHDAVRGLVRFTQANLLDPFFMAGNLYNVIFCRNLLIYLDGPSRQAALRTLETLLAPDGLLFMGHAEALEFLSDRFESVRHAHAFAYRRKTGGPFARPVLQRPAPPPQARASRSTQPVKRKSSVHMDATRRSTVTGLDIARNLANQGRLKDAADVCKQFLIEHQGSAEGYMLLGLIRDAEGNSSQAEECLSKALYLDSRYYEALVHKALLLERRGDTTGAALLRQRAARASKKMMGVQ